jgi:cytoskeletal protein CcmA (bactofilin family)
MPELPRRRFLDLVGAAPNYIAPGCTITGDVETADPVVVCGHVRGDGKIGAALSMARGSAWEGEVHAREAVISGRMTGKLVIDGKLEIRSTAVLRADVVAGSIAIAKGALVEGDLRVTGAQPIVEFDEKRGAR